MIFGKKKNDTSSVYVNESGKTMASAKKPVGIGAKIVCIFAAFLLWLYVSGDETFEKTFENIPVTIEGTESFENGELQAISKNDNVTTITVTGKRSEINNLKASDLKPKISVKGINRADRYSLPIRVETPAGVSVATVYPDAVNVYIDNSIVESVPLSAMIVSGGVKDTPSSSVEVELSHDEVTVEGPASIVSEIIGAVVEIDLGGVINSSTETYGEIVKLIGAEGNIFESDYITVSPRTVDTKIPVYITKTVKVVPAFDGDGTEDYNYDVTPSSVTLISEDRKLMDSIDEITTHPITVSPNSEEIYHSDIIVPAGASVKDDVFEVEVKVKTYAEKKVSVKNIFFVNLSEGLVVADSSKSIEVNLVGSASELASIDGKQMMAVCDLSKVYVGTAVVPAVISCIDGTEDFVDGEYFVSVTVATEESERENTEA